MISAVALFVVATATALPTPCRADEPAPKKHDPVEWTWETFPPAEIAITAVGVGAYVGSLFMAPSAPNWTATNPLDEAGRSAFRLSSPSDRATADTVSTIAVVGVIALPAVGGAIQWLYDKDDEAAAKKAGMFLMSMSFTFGLDGILKNAVARARPCTRDGASSCAAPDSYRSFFSLHSASAFTGAGLCWSEKLGWAVCTVETLAAAGVGVGRMMADQHYLTDVLTGAAVGLFSGMALPALTHIQLGPKITESALASDSADKVLPSRRLIDLSVAPAFTAGPADGGYAGVLVHGTF